MTTVRHEEGRDPEPQEPRWLEAGKLLMILTMAILLFLLAQAMVRHHFFTGGSQNYRMGGGS